MKIGKGQDRKCKKRLIKGNRKKQEKKKEILKQKVNNNE